MTEHDLPRLARRLGAVFLLLAGPTAAADFWISIGAFGTTKAAQAVASEATSKSGVSFELNLIETPDGSLYRVVAGPFGTQRETTAHLAKVHDAGFNDGWIARLGHQGTMTNADFGGLPATNVLAAPAAIPLSQQVSSGEAGARTMPATEAPAVDLIGTSSYRSDDLEAALESLNLGDWSLDDDLPPIEELLEGLPDVPLLDTAPVEPIPTPQGPSFEVTAPPDYGLHRLRRDAAARPFNTTVVPVDETWVTSSWGAETLRTRMKWFSLAHSLPHDDVLRQQTGNATPWTQSGDLRVMWRPEFGPVKLLVDVSTVWLDVDGSHAQGLTFDQTPTGDDRRVMKLTWGDLEAGDNQRLYRFDRLAAEYRTNRWGVTVGRQALSWGNGMVFQPMDLFNPFSPTTIDQDYKAGDDMVLVERLFADGSEAQFLAVGRRLPGPWHGRGDVTRDAASFAAKYRAILDYGEVELMAAQHYDERVVGLGIRLPIGGALMRSDVVWTRIDGQTYVSGILNADYTVGIAGSPVHLFAEYFHNGFGVRPLSNLTALPAPLQARIARGELFNLMRNYVAVGASFPWHFLLNQSFAVIRNLHDDSYVVQAALSYDLSDASRLHAGVAIPVGDLGDEFGPQPVGNGLTFGGGDQAFARFVRYF